MRKLIALLVTFIVILGISATGFASQPQDTKPIYRFASSAPMITPCYTYTSSIIANLTISGNTANCSGTVDPYSSYNATISVTLYKKNGNRWIYLASWSGSSTNGNTASAGGSHSIGTGTYKVVAYGNVGNGIEHPSASVIKTK